MMRRREFVTGLAGSTALWPLAVRAQQPRRLPTIGYFMAGEQAIQPPSWSEAFFQHLRELGWKEGRNITIVHRWGKGRPERYAEIAAEFIRRKVDVIVTLGPAIKAVQRTTSVIPVVFTISSDR